MDICIIQKQNKILLINNYFRGIIMNIDKIIEPIKKLIKHIIYNRTKKANEISLKNIENSTIQQAHNLTINYDSNTLKLQQELSELQKKPQLFPESLHGE